MSVPENSLKDVYAYDATAISMAQPCGRLSMVNFGLSLIRQISFLGARVNKTRPSFIDSLAKSGRRKRSLLAQKISVGLSKRFLSQRKKKSCSHF